MRFLLASLCLLCAGLTGRAQDEKKDPAEEVLGKIIVELEHLGETLTGVKDADSADAARPELKKSVAAILKLRAQTAKLTPPSREVRDRLAQVYRPRFLQAHEKIVAEIGRVGDIPGGRAALTDVSGLLSNKLKLDTNKDDPAP